MKRPIVEHSSVSRSTGRDRNRVESCFIRIYDVLEGNKPIVKSKIEKWPFLGVFERNGGRKIAHNSRTGAPIEKSFGI